MADKKTTKPQGATKGRRGQAPHEPTDASRALCAVLSERGTPHKTIAGIMKISKTTLYGHYRNELDNGADIIRALLAGTLVACALQAVEDHHYQASAIFANKALGGLTDRLAVTDGDIRKVKTYEAPSSKRIAAQTPHNIVEGQGVQEAEVITDKPAKPARAPARKPKDKVKRGKAAQTAKDTPAKLPKRPRRTRTGGTKIVL